VIDGDTDCLRFSHDSMLRSGIFAATGRVYWLEMLIDGRTGNGNEVIDWLKIWDDGRMVIMSCRWTC
jgi:hypothetical protein